MKKDRTDPDLLVARLDALEHVLMVLLATHQDPKAILDTYQRTVYPERSGIPTEDAVRSTYVRYHEMVVGISEIRMANLKAIRPAHRRSRRVKVFRRIGLLMKLRSLR